MTNLLLTESNGECLNLKRSWGPLPGHVTQVGEVWGNLMAAISVEVGFSLVDGHCFSVGRMPACWAEGPGFEPQWGA